MTHQALILIDIQNDYFPGGLWPVHEMVRAADNAARLLATARKNGMEIVHIRHEFLNEDAPFFRPGSEGASIHSVVAPLDGEKVITKSRPNSFQGTDLLNHLQKRDISTVQICGAMSQMCVDATARAAADFGFIVTVVEDACAAKETSFSDQTVAAPLVHAAFMGPLASSYGKVVTTDAALGLRAN